MTVLVAGAEGVRTTDISNPPEARMGAMSMGNFRLWGVGKGVYGGQMARARTSCECILREQDWTQRLEERRMDVLSGVDNLIWEN
jgi:hypothetical protein